MATNSFFSEDDLQENGQLQNQQTSIEILRGKKRKPVKYIPSPSKPPHNRKTMESRIASLKYLINQLFHENNCHIVAFIAQENEVRWSSDLIYPEHIPELVPKKTKEGKKQLSPITEFIESVQVKGVKKLWTKIYNKQQAIREKTPEWTQAKNKRIMESKSKRDGRKKTQLEAADMAKTNLSPDFILIQEANVLSSNIIAPAASGETVRDGDIIAENTVNTEGNAGKVFRQCALSNETAAKPVISTPLISCTDKRGGKQVDKVYSWQGQMYFWCPFAKPCPKYILTVAFPKGARVINLPEDPANLRNCYVDF